jgi:iron complex transport system substrate-binding protein
VKELRMVSFLPSATELACSLGLSDQLVGISHCCDYPLNIRHKPVVVHSALPIDTMSLGEIDVAVGAQLKRGESLYTVDEQLLRDLSPTHILTQDLCQVCAPAGNEVTRALQVLDSPPEIVWMSPHSIVDIFNDLRQLARVSHRVNDAETLIAESELRLKEIAKQVDRAGFRPRVFCAEWIDPFYCCGHWVPEMVEIAGGFDPLWRKWADSVRVTAEQIERADPEVLLIMPCGFSLNDSVKQARQFLREPRFANLSAVRNREVYAVDAGYFSRPGLRVIDGTELLAHILHPNLYSWCGDEEAFRRVVE